LGAVLIWEEKEMTRAGKEGKDYDDCMKCIMINGMDSGMAFFYE
jgi:hypothetical protein